MFPARSWGRALGFVKWGFAGDPTDPGLARLYLTLAVVKTAKSTLHLQVQIYPHDISMKKERQVMPAEQVPTRTARCKKISRSQILHPATQTGRCTHNPTASTFESAPNAFCAP